MASKLLPQSQLLLKWMVGYEELFNLDAVVNPRALSSVFALDPRAKLIF